MRYNQTVKSTQHINHEGTPTFKPDQYTELYSLVCTCLVNEPRFYGSIGDIENRILELVQSISTRDPEYIVKLAYYVRTQMNLRSVSSMLLGEASLLNKGKPKPYISDWSPHIISRADEIAEVIAYIVQRIGQIGTGSQNTSLPSALKRGLAKSFEKFNEYQFGKYRKKDAEVTLRDAIRIVHPKPTNPTQEALYKKIAKDELEIPLTWETYISKNGSTKENWEHILPEMPIFAVLRNLRNFLQNNVSNLDIALTKLTTEKVVRNSRILPFRFYSAYKELYSLEDVDVFDKKKVLNALNIGMELAVGNLDLSGRTAIFIDDSGSMDGTISDKSSVHHNEIGYVLASILNRINPANYTLLFGEGVKEFVFNDNKILSNVKSIDDFARRYDNEIGHATNTWLCVNTLRRNKINVDRIIVISDCQSYNTYGNESVDKEIKEYRKEINNCFVYSIDTNSYGDSDVNPHDKKTLLISGWSDKIFTYIPRFESDGTKIVDEIKNLQLPVFKSKTNKVKSEASSDL